MAKTAAQRQAQYRARRPFADSGEGERRLNLWIGTRLDLALTRLARHYCVPKREIVERLIAAEDERIANDIVLDSPEWEAYFRTAPLRSNATEPG
ncbi:hypothetical protein [Duganella sp. HH105]|uniref:hypothetical protein n=1 Tax=Duganella sp. HH105 TaxID=1781067 RepID=UPI000877DF06|nr:hypothetical protein [Duganella sp. HH105]OEZ64033.1 hypothetical protein DUGA6_05340 [Duganella sp. HH105]